MSSCSHERQERSSSTDAGWHERQDRSSSTEVGVPVDDYACLVERSGRAYSVGSGSVRLRSTTLQQPERAQRSREVALHCARAMRASSRSLSREQPRRSSEHQLRWP